MESHVVFNLFFMSRSFGKPAFAYTLTLVDDFQYAPEWREGDDTQYCRPNKVADQYGCCCEEYPGYCKYYPAFYADVEFCFDYKRVKKSYYKECGESHEKSGEIHSFSYVFKYVKLHGF